MARMYAEKSYISLVETKESLKKKKRVEVRKFGNAL